MYSDLNKFFEYGLKLKSTKRAGWISKVGVNDPESVADHSYSMCLICMVLSDLLGLKTEKILKMAILHDLAESIIGDYMPDEIGKKSKYDLEHSAMELILQSVPASVRTEYHKIWDEYSQNRTRSANFVHMVDKLDLAMQAKEYETDYPKHLLAQFIHTSRKVLKSKNTFPIMLEILNTLK
ncbi:MAG TPA: HD domain-containing protein [Nitrososphaeraceae archaeon]|jgi:putative hydrolase of HD superfamily